MKRILIVPIFIIILGAFGGLLAQGTAAQGTTDKVTVAFSDPSRVGTLHVDLLQGSVTVKAYNGRDVIVESRTRDSNRSRARSEAEAQGMRRLENSATGLTIEEKNNVMNVGTYRFDRSISLDIQVPARTNLRIKTVNGGALVIEGVEGDIEAENNNGAVTLTDVSGSVVAHSLNGKVLATVKRAAAGKPMSFNSLNGDVDVTLPADVKANLKMRTDNGEIYVDAGLDIRVQPSPTAPAVQDTRSRGGRYRLEMDRGIFGTLNGGGPDFELRTMNGNVYIKKPK